MICIFKLVKLVKIFKLILNLNDGHLCLVKWTSLAVIGTE
jgi:hypothetical protein